MRVDWSLLDCWQGAVGGLRSVQFISRPRPNPSGISSEIITRRSDTVACQPLLQFAPHPIPSHPIPPRNDRPVSVRSTPLRPNQPEATVTPPTTHRHRSTRPRSALPVNDRLPHDRCSSPPPPSTLPRNDRPCPRSSPPQRTSSPGATLRADSCVLARCGAPSSLGPLAYRPTIPGSPAAATQLASSLDHRPASTSSSHTKTARGARGGVRGGPGRE